MRGYIINNASTGSEFCLADGGTSKVILGSSSDSYISGRLGVGVTSPGTALDVANVSDSSGSQVRINSWCTLAGDSSGGATLGNNYYRKYDSGTASNKYYYQNTHGGLGSAGIFCGSGVVTVHGATGATTAGSSFTPTTNADFSASAVNLYRNTAVTGTLSATSSISNSGGNITCSAGDFVDAGGNVMGKACFASISYVGGGTTQTTSGSYAKWTAFNTNDTSNWYTADQANALVTNGIPSAYGGYVHAVFQATIAPASQTYYIQVYDAYNATYCGNACQIWGLSAGNAQNIYLSCIMPFSWKAKCEVRIKDSGGGTHNITVYNAQLQVFRIGT